MRTVMSLVVAASALLSPAATGVNASSGQPEDRFASVNGVRLHYLEWSESGQSTLLFLTSFGASAHEFDVFAPKFADRYRVLALTRRGQLPSDQPLTGYDTPTLVADIREFLDVKRI